MADNITQVRIRPATPADGAAINRLIEGLAHYENLPPPDEAAQVRLLRDAFAENPRFEIFLAEVETVIAGYIFIFETYSTFAARPKLYLEDLFVLPQYRQKRVGLALFRYCVELAQQRGCLKLEWSVLDWNEPAQKFYQRLGSEHSREWLGYFLPNEKFEAVIALG